MYYVMYTRAHYREANIIHDFVGGTRCRSRPYIRHSRTDRVYGTVRKIKCTVFSAAFR